MSVPLLGPSFGCTLCSRLAAFHSENRIRFPDWHNGPVPSFGELSARLLIVGLAPGLKGANRTGRPFTGDYAGDLLYETLLAYGFAEGTYGQRADDGLRLIDCRITNAAHCVPPANKPLPEEIRACNLFLREEIAAMTRLTHILALGSVAHQATLMALGARRVSFPFGHARMYEIGALRLFDSYHCSRYNTNTGRLTATMFRDVFAEIRKDLRPAP
ncbi:MAG TPA: uracil-DNA glycosylase [Dongiaceae bacterium]|jgi:uracil-DNA glycosylase family 4|nr:uracil-DNA glycosylase [Dongiaceae bacterium]